MSNDENKQGARSSPSASDASAIWCIVASVKPETHFGEGGKGFRRGTRHFRAGAKVYCFPPLWGDGYERVKVIGHARRSRYVTVIIKSEWLERWRAERVYSPYVIKQLLDHWDNSEESRLEAESLAHWMNTGELSQTELLRRRFQHPKPLPTRVRTAIIYHIRRLFACAAKPFKGHNEYSA